MRLRIVLPTDVLVDRRVDKVVAESVHGSFCLRPRHVDVVAPIVPGLLAFTVDGAEELVAVARGLLVKAGDEVLVSVRDGVAGAELGELQRAVRERLAVLDEREREARRVADEVEVSLLRRFVELEEEGPPWR